MIEGSADRVGVIPQLESDLRHAMLERLLPQQSVGAMLLKKDSILLDGFF